MKNRKKKMKRMKTPPITNYRWWYPKRRGVELRGYEGDAQMPSWGESCDGWKVARVR